LSKFERVLIANRGEIAKRIYHALRDLNITPVIPIVEREFEQTFDIYPYAILLKVEDGIFLNGERLIEIAKENKCQAIHPGYGFLAENADFARLCEQSGIVFIGPPANSIELMGHKETARVIAEKCGVSPVPGFSLKGLNEKQILDRARAVGLPVLIKASLGGGGKGMRRVENEDELFENIRIARSESKQYFASEDIFVEKYIKNPRHIEIQVFSFPGGRTVYLGERECTIQRRHQKIIEESPSPIVDEDMRRRMGEAACSLADTVSYVGAGTVEFIVDSDRNFYFLEMNTRIQVEHPVTEMVYGVDLVKWQIQEAMGLVVTVPQDKIKPNGHAIEFRIYAEDPENNFMPSPGRILRYVEPKIPGVRVESAVKEGYEIFPDFDPMIAKVIVFDSNREDCIEKAKRVLDEFIVLGVKTNLAFLKRVIEHVSFLKGDVDTGFIEKYQDFLFKGKENPLFSSEEIALLSSQLKYTGEKSPLNCETEPEYPDITGWLP